MTTTTARDALRRHHEELARTIAERVAALTESPPGARDLTRLAWQLQALFEVHLEKEEQVYMALLAQYVPEAEQQRIIARMHEAPPERAPTNEDATLDVRSLPPARRHTLIFETFGTLGPGRAFILVNDHDPKPLYYQFQAEQPGAFTWTYLEQGPEVWSVRGGRT